MTFLSPIHATSTTSLAAATFPAIANLQTSDSNSEAQEVSFGQMLNELATGNIETLKGGELSALVGVQGRANVQDVVDAVMSAQRALHTMIAVRDKAVGAYQEISRMTI